MNYYDVLGVSEGAKPLEIKRAYFSMVRQHSPEEDPEMFRKIREAYEQLMKGGEEQGPAFPKPSDPILAQMLSDIELAKRRGNENQTRNACEAAADIYPDEPQVLYEMAIAQRKAGNTGKAVKTSERLVEMEPENRWFWRELAVSYMERGYTKKAYPAFGKAYEMGCRDTDFILMFSEDCEETQQYAKGIEILTELVRREKRWDRDQMPDLLEAYITLADMDANAGKGGLCEIVGWIQEFVRAYSLYVDENGMSWCLLVTSLLLRDDIDADGYRKISDLIAQLQKSMHSEEHLRTLGYLGSDCMLSCLEHDPRLGEGIRRAGEAVFQLNGEELKFSRIVMLDGKLCMLEEREEILPQLEIVEKDYPSFYRLIEDFAQKLKTGKSLDYLKSSMLQQYAKLLSQEEYEEDFIYFQKYPQEKNRWMGKAVSTQAPDVPYVRGAKKIGRNDPCPCGSGKKYKYCCGR